MIRISLKPSKTHKCRQCDWIQVSPGIGLITIREARTANSTAIDTTYLLREHSPEYSRRFEMRKETKAGGETYWLSINHNQNEDSCDCPGFDSHAHCKHMEVLRAIIAREDYVPYSSDPVKCFYSEIELDDPT